LKTETISTQHTPRERGEVITRTAAYYVAFIALGTTGAVLGPTLRGLAEHTHTQLSQISLLFTATSLGYLLGSFLSGRLFDRIPGHPVMAAGLVVLAAVLGLAPLSPLLWLLFVIFLIIGMAQAEVDVGGNTLLVWIHGAKVPPFMNGLHFCFGLGALLSPIVVAQAKLLSGDITWAYWTLAVLMLPVAAWLLRLPSPAIQSASNDDLTRPVDRRLLALMVVFFFLHVGAELSFSGWISTYAVARHLTSETGADYLTSAFWGAFTLSRLLSIPVALRFRPSTILLGGLLGGLVSLVIILLWSDSAAALWLGAAGMGFSIAPMFPTSISLAERRMAITGRVTGWFLIGASLGSMTVPWLIGQLFDPIGPRVVMMIILTSVILALGVFVAIKSGFSRVGLDSKDMQTIEE
jgi:FHS family Na+ dependent glucose MFS transporter 1